LINFTGRKKMRFNSHFTNRVFSISLIAGISLTIALALIIGQGCSSDDNPTEAQPDLVVALSHSPANPCVGETITFTASVTNQGEATAEATTMVFTIGDEDDPPTYEIPELAPDASYTVERQEVAATAQSYGYSARIDSGSDVRESDEANNESSVEFDIIEFEGDTDLVISRFVYSPDNPTTTDLITFTAVVTNEGTTSSGTSTLQLTVGGESDPPGYDVPALAADESYTVQRSLILDAVMNFSATASADKEDDVTETDETNNEITITFAVTEGTGTPDLVISSLTHSPLNPTSADTMTFTAIVENRGTAAADTSTMTLGVGGENPRKAYAVPALAVGGTFTIQRQELLNYAQNYGNTATADVYLSVTESNETNNETIDTYTVTQADVDLIVSSLTHSPANPTTADTLTFTATVKNQGTDPATATTMTLAVGGESMPMTYSIPSLAAGATFTVQRQELLDVAQSYQNTATADAYDSLPEMNEYNNVTTDTFTVTQALPDLVISSLTHSPASPSTVDSMTFTAIISNQGGAAAGASTMTLAVGGESTPASYSIPQLSPGASFTITRQELLDVAQSYMNTATADSDDDVAESNENNNITTDTFTVTQANVDLIISSLTHVPLNPTTVDTMTFTAIITNQGNATAGASTMTLAVGGESTPASYSIPELDPGDTFTITRQELLDVAQSYMNTATADSNSDVTESNESNNVTTDTFTVTQASPDLVVTSLAHAPLNPTTVDTMTFTAIITNQGNATAGASTLTLAVGGESTPASYSIPELDPGDTFTITRQELLDVAQSYQNTATADSNGDVTESNESNNVTIDTFTVTQANVDLIVSSLTHEPLNPTTVDTMIFTAIITNQGNATAGASIMTLAVGGESTPASYLIPELDPGDTFTILRQELLDVAQSYMNTATADSDGDVTESDESNNVTIDTFTVTYAGPDLAIISLAHAPLNPTTVDTMTFTATISNQGNATASASTMTLAVGGESTPASYSIPELSPGASFTITRQELLDVAQSYQNTATADSDGDVAESDESNNVTIDTFAVILAAPDLIVSSLTHSPENPNTSDTITFTAIVMNQGNAAAGASNMTLAVGGESTPASYSVPDLAPGDTFTIQRQEVLDVAQNYQNTATADSDDDVTEADENNNTTSDTFTVEQDDSGPDLIVSSFTHSPENPTTTDTITFTAVVTNQGSSVAGGSNLSIQVGGESTPAEYAIPDLAPGDSYTVQRQEVLDVAQNYQNTATADSGDHVSETDESNNVATDSYSVEQDDSGPDLIVSSFTHSPENPTTTDTITFTAIVTNQGSTLAGGSNLRIQVGGESNPPEFAVPELGAGESYTVQRQEVLDVAQSYQNTATADSGDDVSETNENNNVATDSYSVEEVEVSVPDLAVSSLLHLPANPTTVDTITFQAVVYNDGNAVAGASILTLQVGGESDPATFDIPALSPAESYTVQRQEVLDVAQSYQITATADATGLVSESNENNNVTTDNVTVEAGESGPDLIVSSFTYSPQSPTVEDTIVFTAVVSNTGNQTAGTSLVEIRIGGESTGEMVTVPSLAAGATYSAQRELIVDVGDSAMLAIADVAQDVDESNEANNTSSSTVTVIYPSP
jgi:subtilase family serine protease